MVSFYWLSLVLETTLLLVFLGTYIYLWYGQVFWFPRSLPLLSFGQTLNIFFWYWRVTHLSSLTLIRILTHPLALEMAPSHLAIQIHIPYLLYLRSNLCYLDASHSFFTLPLRNFLIVSNSSSFNHLAPWLRSQSWFNLPLYLFKVSRRN